MKPALTKISVADVSWHLDAMRQDGIDRGGQSLRSGQVLALREKLLMLPSQEFDLAIRTLSKMVDGKEDKSAAELPIRRAAGVELYKTAARNANQGAVVKPL